MEQKGNSSSIPGTTTGQVIQLSERVLVVISQTIPWANIVTGVGGIIGNVLTVLVYFRLGVKQTIHMSFVALAVSDLGCVLTTIWFGICYTPIMQAALARWRLKTDIDLFVVFTSAWPHFGFSRTTALLTAWVSLERCLCVRFPIKVKTIITPAVTKAVLAVIYVIGLCPVTLVYISLKYETSFDPADNLTAVHLYINDRGLNAANRFAFYLYGVVYPLFSWVVVLICAVFLVTKLRKTSKWRHTNTGTTPGTARLSGAVQRNMSQKETRVTRTVSMIACLFIFCSLPISVTVSGAVIWREEFSLFGSQRILFQINGFVSFFFSELNSSINIVVYAVSGGKFRSSLYQLIIPVKCRRS